MTKQIGMFKPKSEWVPPMDFPNIKDADKIVVFHEGRIDEEGNHEELIEKKGRYYALLKQSKET